MSLQHSQEPIHKKKVPSAPPPRSRFNPPKINRYFQKILSKKQILTSSYQQIKPLQKQTQHSVLLSRSVSVQLSKGQTQSSKLKYQPQQTKSLPKINNKKIINEQRMKEIVGSDLGYLNFYSILLLKNKNKDLRHKLSHMTGTSSINSEEDPVQELNTHSNQLDAQKSYQEYDKILMQNQPIIYKRRYFRLKHKAEWGVR